MDPAAIDETGEYPLHVIAGPLADDEAGQVPKAFVVLKGDTTPDHIMRYVAERVAPYKKLRHVELTNQIAIGKDSSSTPGGAGASQSLTNLRIDD